LRTKVNLVAEASSLQTVIFVYPVAAISNQLNTYSFIAVFSTPCGSWLSFGLVSRRSTLISYQTIFFSLLSLQAVPVRHDLSCNSFGLYVCELCAMKEIRDYSEIHSAPYLSCWTKSNFILISG
jgi:hypothetical protein